MMIYKEPGNIKTHRLRIIHLYEADLSLLLGIEWRVGMHNALRQKTGQQQASTVTPNTIRTVPNQVNRNRNRYQTLEDNDELSTSESDNEIESTDSVPGLGGKVSSSSEDTDRPPPLEEIPFDPEVYLLDTGAVRHWRQAARDKVARLADIGAIELPRPNQRIVLDPRFARIEINRAIQQQLQ
jgi:hypothetical protein